MEDEKNITEILSIFSYNLNGPIPIFIYRFDEVYCEVVSIHASFSQLNSSMLCFVSLSSLRHSFFLAQGGAAGAVPAVLRHALEAALYGLLIHNDDDWSRVWESREHDNKSRDRFRREGLSCAKRKLSDKNKGFGEVVSRLLDHLISFGAHPNVNQIALMTELKGSGEDHVFTTETLCGAERRNMSLISIGQVYEVVIQIIAIMLDKNIDQAKLRKELAGIVRYFREFMAEVRDVAG